MSISIVPADCSSSYDQLVGKLRNSHSQDFVHFIFRQRCKSMYPHDLLVAKKDKVQIGLIRRSLKYDTANKSRYLYINFFYILPEHRGNGYGSPLLESGITYGKYNKAVRLHVLNGENNETACHLYQKFGFEWYSRQLSIMYKTS